MKGIESQNKDFSQIMTLEFLFADSAFNMNNTVMVNFTSQFDWAMECPDIWSNIILRVSVKVFWDEINIWFGQGWPLSPLSFNKVLGVLARAISQTNKQKKDKRQPNQIPP